MKPLSKPALRPTACFMSTHGPVFIAVATLLASVHPVFAQSEAAQIAPMAPTGFTGAINSPTANVLGLGSADLSYSSSIPELASRFPGEPFGGLSVGFGVLPGLEVVGRLAFDGNLSCNSFQPPCPAGLRDLSVGGKYQLPWTLPLDTRLAVGVTDFGGAATRFRSAYGVATSRVGPVDLSLGYGRKASPGALLGGVFGSAAFRVNEQWQVIAESDSQAKRIGAAFVQPVTDQLVVQLGASRKLSGATAQQRHQVTASIRYFFEKQAKRSASPAFAQRTSLAQQPTGPTQQQVQENNQRSPAQQAAGMAGALKRLGFAQIVVRHTGAQSQAAAHWQIIAEPLLQRSDQAQAIGTALAAWLAQIGSAPATLELQLTYMGQVSQSVLSSRECVAGFAQGDSECATGQALVFARPTRSEPAAGAVTLVDDSHQLDFKPQIELGLALKSSVGTELGLVDYSLALDLGMQMQLAKGLFWQGNLQIPALQSDDYKKNGAFQLLGHPKARVDQAMLSYVRPIHIGAQRLTTQVSVGSVNAFNLGGQADAIWLDETGLWRVGAILGAYARASDASKSTPALLSVRRSIAPGKWMVEATVGEFLGGDRGYKLKSQHWFGDVALSFFVHDSDGGTAINPRRKFAGFEISLPLAKGLQKNYGWASVRASDRFTWGQRSKIGEKDNVITAGHGETPMTRHGAWADMINLDRGGANDAWAGRDHIRVTMDGRQ